MQLEDCLGHHSFLRGLEKNINSSLSFRQAALKFFKLPRASPHICFFFVNWLEELPCLALAFKTSGHEHNVTCLARKSLACKNCGLSLLLTASNISLGGSLKVKSVNKVAPIINLFNFMFFLVNFGKTLCSLQTGSSKTQMLLLKNNNNFIIFYKNGLFCSRYIVFTFDSGQILRLLISMEFLLLRRRHSS